MLKIKNLRGECQHCGGAIEFHAEHTGSVAACPHCGKATELLLPTPRDEASPLRRKAMVFTFLVAIIVIVGWVAVGMALQRAKRLQAQQVPPFPAAVIADPFAGQGFAAGPVTLAKEAGGALVYALGSVTNLTDRPRFGVRVEIQLAAADGTKLNPTSDYQKVIEPHSTWVFRALVSDRRATAVTLRGITESK